MTISFSGGHTSVTTSSNGTWSKSGLSASVTVTPSRSAYTFSPTSATVTGAASNVDFTGGYTASGTVLDGASNGIGNVTIAFSGGHTSVTTSSNGSWSKAGLSGSVTVTPSRSGYGFSPTSRTVTAAASDVDFTAGYAVAGTVRDGAGTGIGNVTIAFSGSHSSVTTASNGSWSKAGLSGSVTVTPSRSGYSFSPTSRTVTGAANDVDFTGSADASTYTVSGTVRDGAGTGIGSVTISFSGGHESVVTGSNGTWSKSGLSGSVTVTPSRSGYTFSPTSRTVTGAANDVDFTGSADASTYTVSGTVRGGTGTGLGSVTISFSGGHESIVTGSSGTWSKSGLSGSVTVTASRCGYTFSPASRTVTGAASSVDFTGSAASYTASGTVRDGAGNGIADVTIIFGGGHSSVTTASNGTWSKPGLAGCPLVEPSRSGYSFNPTSREVTGPATNVDFTGGYSVSGTVQDGAGTGIGGVTISFSGGHSAVTTRFSAGTGTWSKDYLSGTVSVTSSMRGGRTD